ncbi:unnamed protein product [Lactuca virosa]|uniref:Uncharacterized protein n=1 Tax=Lactuca virosa TaxID=75947 RepID=A0AAU9PT23_9ASTR|nr:unnamed protein product [Lactuca virosa]
MQGFKIDFPTVEKEEEKRQDRMMMMMTTDAKVFVDDEEHETVYSLSSPSLSLSLRRNTLIPAGVCLIADLSVIVLFCHSDFVLGSSNAIVDSPPNY